MQSRGPNGGMEADNGQGKEMNKKLDHIDQIEATHVRGKSLIISVICLNMSLHVVDKPPAWGPWPGPVPDT